MKSSKPSTNHRTPTSSAMADQLKKALPDTVQRIERQNVGNSMSQNTQRKGPNNMGKKQFERHNSSPTSPKTTSSQPVDYDLKESAALAIASNLALSRAIRTLGNLSILKNPHQFVEQQVEPTITEICSTLRTDDTANDGGKKLTNEISVLMQNFEKIWQRIMLSMPESRRPYYSFREQALLTMELVRHINALRNYFSHKSQMGDPFDVSGRERYIHFIEQLYSEAQSKAEATNIEKIFMQEDKITKLTKFGVVFLLNLMLTKSQAERLIQQFKCFRNKALPQTINKRLKKMFCAYSQRDGYSEIPLDKKSVMALEIINYLTLPPLESNAGQKAQEQWKIYSNTQTDEQAPPTFRRTSKIRTYIHITLDLLELLPELSFLGHQQLRYDWEMEDGSHTNSGWETQSGPSIESKNNPSRQKISTAQTYGRNINMQPNERFVYNTSDGNLRFKIKLNDGQSRQGVMRLRDWFNLVFIALTESQHIPKLLKHIDDWLERYQSSLNNINENNSLEEDLQKHYPQQVQAYMSKQPDDLKQRINNRLAARAEWNAQCIERLKKKEMPIHEQIHEILHEFIRGLNRRGRDIVSRSEYVRLQRLLLQYKGHATISEIKHFKNKQEALPDRLSAKGAFWAHIHKTYPTDLVNDNKTHSIWEACIQESKQGYSSNIASLSNLCRIVLQGQKEKIKQAQNWINQANEQELVNHAFVWQVSLQQNVQNNIESKDTSKIAPSIVIAAKHASQYSVLPAGWVQQALEWQSVQHCIAQPKQPAAKRGINFAQKIRKHPTKLSLLTEYYQVKLRHPENDKKIIEKQSVNAISKEDKKCWQSSVKELNDWHTQDKLCLIMAEKLAEAANIQLPQECKVNQFTQQSSGLPLKEKNPQQESVEIILKLNQSTQATRLWRTWPIDKLRRAVCWHYANGSEITIKDANELINKYHSRYMGLAQALIEFEQNFFTTSKGKELIEQAKKDQKKYIKFIEVLETAGIAEKDKELLKSLRNAIFHDALPKQELIQSSLQNSQNTITVEDIGKSCIAQLKKHMF